MRTKLAALASVALAAVLLAAPAQAQSGGPNTEPDFATLAEDTVVVVYPLLNDTDPDGGSLELVGVANSELGVTRVDGPAVVFTPNADFFGDVELTYTAGSSSGQATGQIVLTVTPVNDPPEAVADTASATSGTATNIDVLANDVDVDGDDLSLVSVANPGNGIASVSGRFVVYTANDGFAGVDLVTYVLSDASGATTQGSVTVTVSLPVPTTTTTSTTTTAPTTTVAPATTVTPTTTVATTVAPPTTVPPATTVPPTTIGVSPGTTLVAGPGWTPPSELRIEPGDGNSAGFISAVGRNLEDLYLPLLTLLVVGAAAWLLTQRGRSPLRKRAVVLLGRTESLAVYDKPTASAKVIHRFDYSARQIEVTGRRRDADGRGWLPVATPSGRGWADAHYLTEDVARASFETDLSERDIVRELRRRLKQGATIATSPRGLIDPEAFERDATRRQLGGNATNKITSLIEDWRASFHIDKTASLAALRPPQLRNLHWVSFEAPGLEPWQLFFEYHEGEPYPVAALPETAPVEV